MYIYGLVVRSYLIGGGKGKGKSSSYFFFVFVKFIFLVCVRFGIICGIVFKIAWNYLKFEIIEVFLCFLVKLMGRGLDIVVISNIVFYNRWYIYISWELIILFIYCIFFWFCYFWYDEFESFLWLEKWVFFKLRDV